MTPEERAQQLLSELEAASSAELERRRPEAQALAEAVKREGIDLCHSRATEHSPRIGVLFLAAAKLARIGFADGDRPAHFERDLARDPDAQAELERFTAALSRADGPGGG